jgi:hypothetical protein
MQASHIRAPVHSLNTRQLARIRNACTAPDHPRSTTILDLRKMRKVFLLFYLLIIEDWARIEPPTYVPLYIH